MMDGCKLIVGDCVDVLAGTSAASVDLTVTSPPYDGLRKYGGKSDWDMGKFIRVASELYRVTKDGGVVVWVVGDQTRDGTESGTSFEQALMFKKIGFRLHDTMIYHKKALPMNHDRYEQEFEYMFVLSKGKPKTFNAIRVPCKYPEKPTARQNSYFSATDENGRVMRSGKKRKPVGKDKIKGNVWYYTTGKNHSTKYDEAFKHPAIFPEALARDHIASWSSEGDTVLDPFMGSGTTGVEALKAGRKFVGIEINPEYVEMSRKRIEHETAQAELFG